MNDRQDAFWGLMTYITIILLGIQGVAAFLLTALGVKNNE